MTTASKQQLAGPVKRGDMRVPRLNEHSDVTQEAHYHHHHLSPNREGRLGTTDDFTTSFLHFPLFCTALWDLANSRPVHSLMLFPPLPLSALSSSPFHRALQDGFG